MKYEIKSIRIWSFLKITFFLNIFVGFICGIVMAFLTASALTVMGEMPFMSPYNVDLPSDFPIGALFIIYPIIGAIFSAVFLTIFEVFLIGFYNLIAKLTGGLELNLHAVAEAAPLQQPIVAQANFQATPLPPPSQPLPPPQAKESSTPLTPPESPVVPESSREFEPPKPPPPEPRSRGDFEPPNTNPDEPKPE